jgi:hypothetical protein
MRLVSFRCNNLGCTYERDELFESGETIPEALEDGCPICDNALVRFDIKDNSQVWQFNDKR